ncbi:MAG: PEGA domain-containing protein [Bacteroidota bacterium]|nr:PEGA domain-containing protein [Bacteroidota bacterium]
MPRLLLIIAILLSLTATAQQNISVKSFRTLPRDMDARINHLVTDQNGDKAALIKVVTTETGFIFEAGSLGIVKTEQKTSEIWVYVPWGSRKITIKHPQLGMLRNYIYPEAIKKATVYEMVLTTGKVVTTIEEAEIPTQYLIITSEPEGAIVFIDEQQVGTTTFQRKYEEGEYTYRLEYPKYHPAAGKVTLKEENKSLHLTLKPNFGHIHVTSAPEDGMQIFLNDENTGKTTPALLTEISSGEHHLQLKDTWYQANTKLVQVNDNDTTDVDVHMRKTYATLCIKATPGASLYIDNEEKGTGKWEGRLSPGVYSVTAEKDKHYKEKKQVKIAAGEDQNLSFNLKGKTGTLDVITMPIAAEIYLNNEKYGTSPLTIKDLLIGDYQLELRKKGYATHKETITITEDETLEINETLASGKEITITSVPDNAFVYIDEDMQGKTPLTTNLSFGKHTVEVNNGHDSEVKTLDVSTSGPSVFLFEIKKEVSITSEPPGADIYINGKHQGQTPATLVMMNKPTTIKLTKDKYRDKTIDMDELPRDNQISAHLDKINIVNGYSLDIKVGTAKDAGFGKFGSFGIAMFINRLYVSSTIGIPAQPHAFDGDISYNCDDIMVNDIDEYSPIGRYYLGENNYNFAAIQEYSNMVFSIQAGYQFAFPIPFAIHAGYGGRKINAYQKVYQAKHDYFSIDSYANDISEGDYFTSNVAYSDGYNSLIVGIDIPVGFLKFGAEYWINTEVGNAFYISAGLFFSDSNIKKMH